MLKLPLTNDPSRTFRCVLYGVEYKMRTYYNSRSEKWYIDFEDPTGRKLQGVALVGGVDILAPYVYTLSNLYVINLSSSYEDPTSTNLEGSFSVVALTDAEMTEFTGA